MLKKVEDKFILAGSVNEGHYDNPANSRQSVIFDDRESSVFMRVLDRAVEYHPDARIVSSATAMMAEVAKFDANQSYQSSRSLHTV